MRMRAAVLLAVLAAGCGSDPEPAPAGKKTLEGVVTGVKSDHTSCFIDIGQKDGVGVGQVFIVERDGREIGWISADGLEDESSWCREIPDRRVEPIRKGDRVRARK